MTAGPEVSGLGSSGVDGDGLGARADGPGPFVTVEALGSAFVERTVESGPSGPSDASDASGATWWSDRVIAHTDGTEPGTWPHATATGAPVPGMAMGLGPSFRTGPFPPGAALAPLLRDGVRDDRLVPGLEDAATVLGRTLAGLHRRGSEALVPGPQAWAGIGRSPAMIGLVRAVASGSLPRGLPPVVDGRAVLDAVRRVAMRVVGWWAELEPWATPVPLHGNPVIDVVWLGADGDAVLAGWWQPAEGAPEHDLGMLLGDLHELVLTSLKVGSDVAAAQLARARQAVLRGYLAAGGPPIEPALVAASVAGRVVEHLVQLAGTTGAGADHAAWAAKVATIALDTVPDRDGLP